MDSISRFPPSGAERLRPNRAVDTLDSQRIEADNGRGSRTFPWELVCTPR